MMNQYVCVKEYELEKMEYKKFKIGEFVFIAIINSIKDLFIYESNNEFIYANSDKLLFKDFSNRQIFILINIDIPENFISLSEYREQKINEILND